MRIVSRVAASLLASAIFIAGTASAAPLPDAVSAATLAAPPSIEAPLLSPAGDKMALKMLVKGKQTLVVVPLANGGTPAALAAGDVDVNWWRWVGNDWLLIGIGNTEVVFGQDYYVTRLLSVSSDLQKMNQIGWARSGQFADDIIWSAKDGSTRYLIAKQTGFDKSDEYDPSVFEGDAATGKEKLLIGPRDGVYSWQADGKGNVRLGLAHQPVNDVYSVLYRADNSSAFTRLKDSAEPGKGLPIPLIYRADGSAITIHNADGFDSVYELALPSFTLGKKLYSAPGYDVDAVKVNPTIDTLTGVSFIGTKRRDEWLDPRSKTVQEALDAAFGKDNGRILSRDQSGTKFLIEAGDPSQAGGTYFWDLAAGSPKLIGWNNPALKDRKLSPVKSVRFKARDGTPIEAVLTLPRGRTATKLPLIVMPHGGPGARDEEMFDWWTQYLAEQGYAVIQPNYRGSTGYGTAFFDKGKGEWGLKMQDDLIDSIGWAAKEGLADPKRVCIVGASYGGYAAMRGAQRDGSAYRCAISYAGVSDLKGMLAYDSKFFSEKAATKNYWKDQAKDFAAVSPRFHPTDFSIPILIAHGAKDKRVPIKQSRLMVEELRKAGKPVTYLEQKEGDHHFSRTEDRLEFLNAMKAFLDQHNPA